MEHPIAFASRTLTDVEKNYGHVEKEDLSIIYGVRKFHQYLCGRYFTLITDHKPLLRVFSPVKSWPMMTLQRLQRWALILMGYDYKIKYHSSAQHANADALSRLPCGGDTNFDKEETIALITTEVLTVESQTIADFPLSAKTIADHNRKDRILSKVLDYVENGWPARCQMNDEGRSFRNAQTEMSMCGVLLRDNRIIVPMALRTKVLKPLYASHLGMTRMKSLARLP